MQGVRNVFGESGNTLVNNTKSFIGHSMGAAGAIELAGNIPSFSMVMLMPPSMWMTLDPNCSVPVCSGKRSKKKDG